MSSEKSFQDKVEKFLTDEGVYYVKYWGGGIYTRSGVPDLICCIEGMFMGIELKADGGKVSELQHYNLNRIYDSGGMPLVLYPHEFEMFKGLVRYVKKQMLEEKQKRKEV
jgi:hypothetical protein